MSDKKDPKDLTGMWFHEFHSPLLDFHGQVLAMLTDDLLRIQLYEPTLSEPPWQMVVPFAYLVGMELYDTEADWNLAWQVHREETA